MSRLEDFMRYNNRPATGKTWAMLNGALTQPTAIVIVANHQQGKSLRLPRDRYITIDDIQLKMQASRGPFVIDHFALELLFAEHERTWVERLEEVKESH